MKRSATLRQGLESPNEWPVFASSLIEVGEHPAYLDVLGIEEFAKKYLPHYLIDQETGEPVDFAAFQREIFSIVEDRRTRKREAWAAPREHAKSTIMCTIVTLWWTCYRLKRFIVIVSDTSSQAEGQLQTVIMELEDNEKIREDFHISPAIDRQGNVVSWRDDEITTSTGVTIAAKGAGKSIRGIKKKAFRPDAVVIDDLENDESVLTKYQRDKLQSWFEKTLLNILAKGGDLYYIGTILHYDSVLARTMKKTDVWNVRLWRAIETYKDKDGNKVELALWPAYWPLERLADKKLEIGSIAFACEFLNEPLEAGDHPIKKEWFCYYSRLPGDLIKVQTVDPAVSTKTTADYSAICTLGYSPSDSKFYLIDMWRDRVTLHSLITMMISLYSKHQPTSQGIEVQGFQQAVKQEAERLSTIPVYPITRTKDKVTRAVGVSVHFEYGRVLFPREAPWLDEFEAELIRFPTGENDDMLDTIVDAIEAFLPGQQLESVLVVYDDPVRISPV